MNNIIRLDPDVVIASSPTPFETTNHINTIKLRICTLTFRATNDAATDLHTSFLHFFSLSSFLPLRTVLHVPSFIRLREGIRCTGAGRGKHVYTRREASWWRAIKKQFSASSRERAFTTHRVHDDKASFVWNSNYVLNLSWRGKRGDDDMTDMKN